MIKQKLLQLLEGLHPEIDFMTTDKLMTDGVLDSILTIEIMSGITKEFGVDIPFDEYTEDNFNSVDALAALIEKYQK